MDAVDRDFRKVFLILLLPVGLIFLLAGGLGTWAFGPRGDLAGRSPALVAHSSLSADDLAYCLGKDWGRRLALQRARSPDAPANTTRLHNPISKITVDVTDVGGRREVRAYTRGGRPISPPQAAAVTDCATGLNRAARAALRQD